MRPLYRKRQKATIELAPLIDIVFILLIFFAVSSSLISVNQGIPIDVPQASSSVENTEGITVSIKEDGSLFLDDMAISTEDLPGLIRQHVQDQPDLPIVFNAHRGLAYDVVISVLDRIRLAGGSAISLQVEKIIQQ